MTGHGFFVLNRRGAVLADFNGTNPKFKLPYGSGRGAVAGDLFFTLNRRHSSSLCWLILTALSLSSSYPKDENLIFIDGRGPYGFQPLYTLVFCGNTALSRHERILRR